MTLDRAGETQTCASHQAMLARVDDQFESAAELKLLEHVVQVCLHRALRHDKLLRNFTITEAGRHASDRFQFTRREHS